MHTAVDRVIRSFLSKHPASLHPSMSGAQSEAARDEAQDFATQLLENYKNQLARRSPKLD
jgi:hypothetical protein